MDEDYTFLTFDDVDSTCIEITHLNKIKLEDYQPIEFTIEEKEKIKKLRKEKDEYSKEICTYYDKCLEVIEIINKYYDSEGKLKN